MLTTQPKKKRAANRKKHLRIKKTTFVILTMHMLQMLTTQPKKKRAANRNNTCKLRKQLPQFYNAHASNAHNTTKKRTAVQVEKNTCKLRKLSSFWQRTRFKCSQHNQKRNALQIEKTPAN